MSYSRSRGFQGIMKSLLITFFFFLTKGLVRGLFYNLVTKKKTRVLPHPLTQQGPTAQEQGRVLRLQSALLLENKQLLTSHIELKKSVGLTAPMQALQLPCPFKAGMLGARSKLLTAPGPRDSLGHCQDVAGINSQFKNIWNFQSTAPACVLNISGTGRSVLKSES